MRTVLLIALAVGLPLSVGAAQQPAAAAPSRVPLYDNLGPWRHRVTTRSPRAQLYFDQGLRLTYAFNHEEAVRSFAEAERLDPRCAMCAWGVALALGPNINAPMDSAAGVRAYAAVRRAQARASGASAPERAYIAALAKRYAPVPLAQRAALDSAYATAMRGVADANARDDDAQTLYAESLMDLSPWAYWTHDGMPRPDTREMVGRLERVIQRTPSHPGACHYYIHAVEARDATRAVPCAERLAALMPGAGHLVHMPGHIYIRVGRFMDAVRANEHAVHADHRFFDGPAGRVTGTYSVAYYPHNWHFLAFAATMAGAGKQALHAAKEAARAIPFDVARQVPLAESVSPVAWWTMVSFGRWDELLAEPLPPSDLRYLTGMAYYGRGMAFAARARWPEAGAALDTVRATAAAAPDGENRTALRVAAKALEGEIALRRGEAAAAVAAFREGVQMEDGMQYMEPPTWYYPLRHSFGKALLAYGRADEAERAYRDDLVRFPENGWALFGLSQSLEQQGKRAEAAEVRERFKRAWRDADVTLTASRF